MENFRIRGTEDNQQANISWDAASTVGVNGGVVDGSLVYNVVEYFPDETDADNQLKVLTTTQDLSYTADREPTEEMEQHFYAVIPQTSAGVGQAQLDHVILGQLKAVPFAESFVEGGLSASGWVTDADVSQYGTQWYILSDDEEQTSQDGDGGSAHKVTLADGVSTTALASAPENGFVYDGVSYYREGLALPLACTEGDDY